MSYIIDFFLNKSSANKIASLQYFSKEDIYKLTYDSGIFDILCKIELSHDFNQRFHNSKKVVEDLIELSIAKLSEMNPEFAERLNECKDPILKTAIDDGIIESLCKPHDRYRTGDDFGSIRNDCQRTIELVDATLTVIAEE